MEKGLVARSMRGFRVTPKGAPASLCIKSNR